MKLSGYLMKDDDGHWYIIPDNAKDRFIELSDAICSNYDVDKYVDNFISEFEQYRLSGGITGYKVTMEIE